MEKSIQWRIQVAVILTSLGALYYLAFLFYLSGGVPMEKIHHHITHTWPELLADNVALVSPVFLCVGLALGYSYNRKKYPRIKPEPEPEYKFEFNWVNKDAPEKEPATLEVDNTKS